MFLRNALIASRAHLDHPLRADRTGAGRRLLVLYKRKVWLLFRVRAAVKQPDAARRVLQGTRVTDEGGRVDGGRLPLPQRVVPLVMGHPLSLERVPLFDEVLVAVGAALDPSGRVHGPGAARPRVQHQAGEERAEDRRLRDLLGYDVLEAAALVLVPAHVADFRHRILIGHAEVEDVRARGRVGVLAVEGGVDDDRGAPGAGAMPEVEGRFGVVVPLVGGHLEVVLIVLYRCCGERKQMI